MKMYRLLFILMIISFCVPPADLDAQNANISWSSFNMGYAVSSSFGTKAQSVVGQSFIGRMSEDGRIIESGFLADTLFRGTVVSVIDEPVIPAEFRLEQNFPNPFNPGTTIQFQLPAESHVTLIIYDVLGQEVATLIDEKREAGKYIMQFDGSNITSGIYFYRLHAGSYIETKKFMLLK
jgi:hypothetical protein